MPGNCGGIGNRGIYFCRDVALLRLTSRSHKEILASRRSRFQEASSFASQSRSPISVQALCGERRKAGGRESQAIALVNPSSLLPAASLALPPASTDAINDIYRAFDWLGGKATAGMLSRSIFSFSGFVASVFSLQRIAHLCVDLLNRFNRFRRGHALIDWLQLGLFRGVQSFANGTCDKFQNHQITDQERAALSKKEFDCPRDFLIEKYGDDDYDRPNTLTLVGSPDERVAVLGIAQLQCPRCPETALKEVCLEMLFPFQSAATPVRDRNTRLPCCSNPTAIPQDRAISWACTTTQLTVGSRGRAPLEPACEFPEWQSGLRQNPEKQIHRL